MERRVARAQVMSITGRPERIQIRKVIGVRVRSLRATVTTLAVEPMGVPFPPKPTPRASAHQSGEVRTSQLPKLLDHRDQGDHEWDIVDDRGSHRRDPEEDDAGE